MMEEAWADMGDPVSILGRGGGPKKAGRGDCEMQACSAGFALPCFAWLALPCLASSFLLHSNCQVGSRVSCLPVVITVLYCTVPYRTVQY